MGTKKRFPYNTKYDIEAEGYDYNVTSFQVHPSQPPMLWYEQNYYGPWSGGWQLLYPYRHNHAHWVHRRQYDCRNDI
jgi:hypothetical protein